MSGITQGAVERIVSMGDEDDTSLRAMVATLRMCAEELERGERKTIGHVDPVAAVEWHLRDMAGRFRRLADQQEAGWR